MIGKIPKTGRGFRGTFNYLVRGKRDAENPKRLAWMETRNLFVEDYEKIPRMMRATAAQSKKCQKPVYHFLISWRDDEAPADPTMRRVADRALADLGLTEHQAVLAAHRDTQHRHLHILVNRVHPETGKAWHTGKDWERLERCIARQAMELGFLKVDGRHNTPEKMSREAKRARDTEYQMATRKHATMPLDRWSLEEIRSRRTQLGPIFDQARSWDHLERLLAGEGLALTAKGQGLIIDDGLGFMKLSDLGKQVRLKGLETLYRESFADFDRRRVHTRTHEDTPAHDAPEAPARPHIARAEKKPDKPVTGDTTSTDTTTAQPRRDNGDEDRETEDKPRKDRLEQEAEKDKLREAWRAQRRAAHATRTPPAQPADSGDDTSAPAGRTLPAAPRQETPASPRQDAFAALTDAHAKLDLSRKLHDMGLISKQDLMRARDDVDTAHEEVAKHQTFSEFVADGVRNALGSAEKPAPKPTPAPKPEKPDKPRKRPKDQDRDR